MLQTLYHRQVEDLSAFILAGGKSSRMGRDKPFLELAGRTLLVRALELAKSVASHVAIVGDPDKFARFAPVVADQYADRGPLAGIHAALTSSATQLNLILGVDLPFVDSRLLSFLTAEARASNAVVTVPYANGYLQTLCAVYRKDFATVAQAALSAGKNKVDAAYAQVSVQTISEEELRSAGFDPLMFRNVNSPGDLQQAQRELESRASSYHESKGTAQKR